MSEQREQIESSTKPSRFGKLRNRTAKILYDMDPGKAHERAIKEVRSRYKDMVQFLSEGILDVIGTSINNKPIWPSTGGDSQGRELRDARLRTDYSKFIDKFNAFSFQWDPATGYLTIKKCKPTQEPRVPDEIIITYPSDRNGTYDAISSGVEEMELVFRRFPPGLEEFDARLKSDPEKRFYQADIVSMWERWKRPLSDLMDQKKRNVY